MKRLPVVLALAALAFSAASAATIVDLGGFPSPVRLQAEGGAALDQAGGAVALADLNGNGAADLIVAARYADPRGRTNAGQVFVVYGGATVQGTVFLTDAYAGPTLRGAAAFDQFGEALTIGDFNGDGRDDLAVSASWASSAGRANSGIVYLFLGTGTAFPSVDLSTQTASVTVWGAGAGHRCGSAVALGDLDGDGRDELIIGCPRAGPAGRVYVVPGTSSSQPTIDLAANGAAVIIEGTLAGGEFGAALATGAANQDMMDDLLVGAPYASPVNRSGAGAAYLILGRTPFGTIPSVGQAAALTVLGAAANDNLGSAVALGDLDGDNRGDLVLGAPGASPAGLTSAGAAYAVLLPQSLPATVDLATTPAAITLAGLEGYDKMGTAVSVADLDGDGRLDMLAGAPNGDPPGRPQAGVLWAVSGTRAVAGRDATVITAPDLIVYGVSASDRAASSLTVGDFTADSALDLAIGAPRADTALGRDAGSVYVVRGPFPLLGQSTPTATPTATATPTLTPTPPARHHHLPLMLRTSFDNLTPTRSGGNHDTR